MASLGASASRFLSSSARIHHRAAGARPLAVRTYASSKADEIKSTVQSKPLVVYSKTYCPYCSRVKQLLVNDMKLPATVFELDQMGDGDLIQSSLQSLTGRRTVPQVFIGGKFVGGCDDTMAANDAGTLQQLLKEAGLA